MVHNGPVLVILGMMGRCPFGGVTWDYLNWLRGFDKIGAEVYYVEDDATWPYDPAQDTISEDPAYAVAYVARAMNSVGLGERWAYRALWRGSDACYGMTHAELT